MVEDPTSYINQLLAWLSVRRLQRNRYSLFAEIEKCLINTFSFLSLQSRVIFLYCMWYDAVQETGALNGEGTVTQAGLRKSLTSGNSAREKEVNSVELQHSSSKVSMAVSYSAVSLKMSPQTSLYFMQGTNLFFFLHRVFTPHFSCIIHPNF